MTYKDHFKRDSEVFDLFILFREHFNFPLFETKESSASTSFLKEIERQSCLQK